MPANNTNQSMLRGIQGGSPTTRGQNQRAQRSTRNSNPNTAYNSGGNGMFSNYFGYNPWGMNPAIGQYGNQQANLGRYRPPTMSNGSWSDSGGYAYNVPNAYGSTGMDYMSGFNNLFGVFNPFMGYAAPSGMTTWGNYNQGQQGQDAQAAAMGANNRPLRTPLNNAFGTTPGMTNTDGIGRSASQLSGAMGNYRKPMQIGGPVTQTSSSPFRNLPWGFGA